MKSRPALIPKILMATLFRFSVSFSLPAIRYSIWYHMESSGSVLPYLPIYRIRYSPKRALLRSSSAVLSSLTLHAIFPKFIFPDAILPDMIAFWSSCLLERFSGSLTSSPRIPVLTESEMLDTGELYSSGNAVRSGFSGAASPAFSLSRHALL